MSEPTAAPTAPEASPPTPPSTALGSSPTPNTPPPQPGPSTPPTAASFSDLIKDDKFVDGWTERLPDHLKPYKGTLERYPGPMDVLGALGNANQALSKRVELKAPGPDATPEEQAAFAAKMRAITGAPESPDGYGIKPPDNIPEGMQWNEDLAKSVAAIGVKHHISPAAMQELLAAHNESVSKLTESSAAAREAEVARAEQALRKEWGLEFQANADLVKREMTAAGLDFNDPRYGNDVALAKHFLSYAKQLRGDTHRLPGEQPPNSYEARSKAVKDSDDYKGKNGPEKAQAAVEELRRLWHAAKGTTPV